MQGVSTPTPVTSSVPTPITRSATTHHNPSQNPSHQNTSLHHQHHFNTHFSDSLFHPTKTTSNRTSSPLEQSSVPTFSFTLLSLSSLSPSRLFSRFHSASRQPKTPSDSSKTHHRAISAPMED